MVIPGWRLCQERKERLTLQTFKGVPRGWRGQEGLGPWRCGHGGCACVPNQRPLDHVPAIHHLHVLICRASLHQHFLLVSGAKRQVQALVQRLVTQGNIQPDQRPLYHVPVISNLHVLTCTAQSAQDTLSIQPWKQDAYEIGGHKVLRIWAELSRR